MGWIVARLCSLSLTDDISSSSVQQGEMNLQNKFLWQKNGKNARTHKKVFEIPNILTPYDKDSELPNVHVKIFLVFSKNEHQHKHPYTLLLISSVLLKTRSMRRPKFTLQSTFLIGWLLLWEPHKSNIGRHGPRGPKMATRVRKAVYPKDFEHSRQVFESSTSSVRKVDSGGRKEKY